MNSDLANLIKNTDLIIWDEAVMAHRHVFSTVDTTFRDIMKNDKFFGNKLMVFGGDFRQILPVVPNGNRAAIVQASLKYTKFWKNVNQHKLTENMRIKTASFNLGKSHQTLMDFAKYLLSLGEGKFQCLKNSNYTDDIQLPINLSQNVDELELIKKVFPDINNNYKNTEFITSRAILTPKNKTVDLINELASTYFPGIAKTYLSTDSVTSEKDKCK